MCYLWQTLRLIAASSWPLRNASYKIRGVCIGNPAAPAICAAAVSIDEYFWARSLHLMVRPCILSRYVDNRLVCIPRWCLENPQWASLLHLGFYKEPVELECCNSDAYLGFTLNVEKGTFSYIIPPHAGQYRSPLSAGSMRMKLSGLRSRLHLLYAGTFPPSLRENLAK